ncbi:MAG: chitobiase/beta-hexosaminidase C-terminal domain-containing protein [Fibrobacteria bacterium]|nr:chitobiase/beta-hexosaminidase C-terminal domain-containing protein [Fibrobacteria bacterium]
MSNRLMVLVIMLFPILLAGPAQAVSVKFIRISTLFKKPIGVDYHEPTNSLIMSANYPNGQPYNLERIEYDGSHVQFSSVAGLTNELKIATARTGSAFPPGTLFTGNGIDGQIIRVSPDGLTVDNPWVDLPGTGNGLMRGSLMVDPTGAFDGELVVCTTNGQVWRINADGLATLIASVGAVHLEGLQILPDEPDVWGPLAGTVVVGAEAQHLMYVFTKDGRHFTYNVGVDIEDIDLISEGENFFGVNYGTGQLLGVEASEWEPVVGRLLLTQETHSSGSGLFTLHWNGAKLVTEAVGIAPGSASIGQWEHVNINRAGVKEISPVKLPPPTANPVGGTFSFKEIVSLSHLVEGAEIYYLSSNNSSYELYTSSLEIVDTESIMAYAVKKGWANSDTISEMYTKEIGVSILQVMKITGEPLGGTSYLTENDSTFVIKLTVPYATISSVVLNLSTATGQDTETLLISNPQIQNDALLFIDTVKFAVGGAYPGNAIVEAFDYDQVSLGWSNPKNLQDNPSASFSVKPAPQDGKIYFADSNWVELTNSLLGTETILYVVVEDAVFDPVRMNEYVVTLTNKKGDGNEASPDQETYQLEEISPGKYGAIISAVQSPPVGLKNNRFEIRLGDELKAIYTNPVNPSEKTDIIGYGIPTQQPGQIVFTNEDGTVPPVLMAGNLWDADKGKVYLQYTDDYVEILTRKKLKISIENTDGQGHKHSDVEIIDMTRTGKIGDLGIWTIEVMLDDNPLSVSGDGKLQYYFYGEILAEVATHKTGTSERLEGDTTSTTLSLAKANEEEKVSMKDPVTGGVLSRNSEYVEVCVQDQVYSAMRKDTLILDRIECASSGDRIENVLLIQTGINTPNYCGRISKMEGTSGQATDTVLHCQDIDNILSRFSDPIYGTQGFTQATIMDVTASKLQFLDVLDNGITSFSHITGEQIKVRLTNKTPNLYITDTLIVKLRSTSGDTLDVLVIETGVNTGVFEALVTIGFSETPNLRDNIIEGKLDLASASNQMSLMASKGSVSTSIVVTAAYIPVEKAWIVDGNGDGQGDSIYVSFKSPIPSLPSSISSIDWPYEGAQGYIANTNTMDISLSEINFVIQVDGEHAGAASQSTMAILIPGVLDKSLGLFPDGATRFDPSNPPELTLPEGKLFQGQNVGILDGMGAVVMNAKKQPSDNSYYKDPDGFLQKQPDTLTITLSEKIHPLSGAGTPWDSLFLFKSPEMNNSEAYHLISLPGTRPEVIGPDSLTWVIIVDNSINTIKPMVDDHIFLNPQAAYIDASPFGNWPVPLERVIIGLVEPDPINHSTIFVPVIGSSVDDPQSLIANLYVDENGKIYPGKDVITITNPDGSSDYARMWVKPPGLQWDGSVSEPGVECTSTDAEATGQSEFPDNCLSTVQVFSDAAYRAEIAIFDHLGKFVHQSVQYFGQCGELDNRYRRTSRGLQSWLVWNQKDQQSNYVGSGVYIWKVKFLTSAGVHTAVYRQGIVRAGTNPAPACAQQ